MIKYTLRDFDKEFPDDDTCLEWIKNHRWPHGITCEKCGKVTKHHKVSGRKVYECDYCGTQISPTADTIFHKSSTSLRTWFQVIYRMASTRCGISAKQIERETGVTYKTAWRMFNQIRKLLEEDINDLGGGSGNIEVDETYIGGRRSGGKRGRGAEGKKIVVGMVERQGKIIATTVPNVKANTLIPIVAEKALPSSTIHTDELLSYNKLSHYGYEHKRVHHSSKVYVNGDAHTNTIEGFWSLLKRGLSGAYHSVSEKYLQHYLNEYCFRYNHRNDLTPMFKSMLNRI